MAKRGNIALVGAALLVTILAAACSSPPADRGSSLPGAAASQPSSQSALPGAPVAAPADRPLQRVTVGTAGPSLSWLPAQIAYKQGFFQEEGLAPEFVQVGGNSVVPALLSNELDFTTILSAIGAHAGNGGPTKIVQFHSVRLQHVLTARPEFSSMNQLVGKRIAVQSLGTLTAFEARKLIEHFNLGDAAIVSVGGDLERLAALGTGAADASVTAIPMNLVAEREGLPTLLRIGTILEIPQAGLGTSDTALHDRPDLVRRGLRAAARGLPLITNQRDVVVATIAELMELSPDDAARAYEQVAETYSTNGLPTDSQMAAYLELMRATAGVGPDVTAQQIADFAIARQVAAELGLSGP